MLVTSSTTAFAFLSSVFSKLVPIRSFGIFAAIIIPMNFILVITLYPAFIIIEEKNIKKINTKVFSICRKKKDKKEENTSQEVPVERPEELKEKEFILNLRNHF